MFLAHRPEDGEESARVAVVAGGADCLGAVARHAADGHAVGGKADYPDAGAAEGADDRQRFPPLDVGDQDRSACEVSGHGSQIS